MSSLLDGSLQMRLELARDLLQPEPSCDLKKRLGLIRSILESQFASDIPQTESSTNVEPLVKHPDLSDPSFHTFPNNDTIMKQDPNLKDCKDMFQLFLSVPQFRSEEIDVNVVGYFIVVHGKHYELSDGHGSVVREFTRRYKIPADVESSTLRSVINKYGVLFISASKKIIQQTVAEGRRIPVEIEKPLLVDRISHQPAAQTLGCSVNSY